MTQPLRAMGAAWHDFAVEFDCVATLYREQQNQIADRRDGRQAALLTVHRHFN